MDIYAKYTALFIGWWRHLQLRNNNNNNNTVASTKVGQILHTADTPEGHSQTRGQEYV